MLENDILAEYSRHQFENFLQESMIKVIGKVRRCIADLRRGTPVLTNLTFGRAHLVLASLPKL